MTAKLVKLKDGYNLLIDQPLGRLLEATCSISEIKRLEENNISTKKLSLKNCEAIERGYDLDELFESIPSSLTNPEKEKPILKAGFIVGFQKALEIFSDKKFSETDLYRAFLINSAGNNDTLKKFFDETVLPTFQGDSEWDVEIVFDKDCYSSNGRCDKSEMADCIICTPVTYLKDADGCLILKRI